MATSSTDYEIAPEDGWVNVAAAASTYLKIKPGSRGLKWALFQGAAAPVTALVQSFANLSYTGQPVGGSAAYSELTLSDVAVADETVTIGSQVYTWKAAPSAADEVLVGATADACVDNLVTAINAATRTSEASSVLTLVGNASAGDVVTLGTQVYTFRTSPVLPDEVLIGGTVEATCDNLVAAINDSGVGHIQATGILTAAANLSVGDTVTVGDYVYTIVTTPAAPFEVKLGATASDTLDNIIAAVNSGTGVGSLYGYHTPANPFATAAAGAGDTIDFTAVEYGPVGNSIVTTETSATASWGAATLAGGVLAYGPNTVANADATAADGTGTTVDVTAIAEGVAGNAVVTTTDISGASWADTTLGGGTGASTPGVDFYGDGTVANTVVTAANGGSGVLEATARLNGTAANSAATTETMGDGAWADTTLGGGTGASVAGVAGQTIALAGVTYTFVTVAAGLSTDDTPNEVVMGASATLTYQNLEKAVNLTGTEGTTYGVGTEINPSLVASDDGVDDITFTSRLYDGTDGDGIAVAETVDNAAFDGAATATAGGADLSVGAIYQDDEEVEILTTTDGATYVRVLSSHGRPEDQAVPFNVIRDAA